MALGTIAVAHTGMQVINRVTLHAGIRVMGKKLGCCSGGWAATAVNVTGQAFSRVTGIMALY